jgi:acetylornithine/N-succinyldiaminopimelate aminotransferase
VTTSPTHTQDVLQRYQSSLMGTFGVPRMVLVRGEGCHVWDAEGNRYLDLLGGIAVNALGHAHPALVEAVTRQLTTLGHVSNFFTTEPQVALAERLLALSGRDGRVFLTSSGTEANEAALKLTRRTGRTKLVAAEGAFHGRTMGALALTSKAAYREPFEPLPGEVTFVPYGDAAALAAAVDDATAAVVLEPVQGEAGVVVPPADYLAQARQITAEHGALLWVDEVQTGIGRTGDWFAHDPAASPDVVTLAKGLGGGVPVGACIAYGDAGALLGAGNHGTTFGGNPVACAAALAVLATIESDGLLARVRSVGRRLREGLVHDHVSDVRGAGLLIGLTLDRPLAAEVVAGAQARGFILNACTPERVRLAPPLVLTEGQAETVVAAWPEILSAAYEGGTP